MTIVTEISEILKSQEHLSAVETALIHLMSDYLTSQVAYCLDSLDKELVASYCQDGWSIDRLEERQVTFFFGSLSTVVGGEKQIYFTRKRNASFFDI